METKSVVIKTSNIFNLSKYIYDDEKKHMNSCKSKYEENFGNVELIDNVL